MPADAHFNKLKRTLEHLAPHRGRDETFRDAMFIWAAALRLPFDQDPAVAREYTKTMDRYKEAEQKQIREGFNLLIEILDERPRDVLGHIYMDLGLGNSYLGQFFTPDPISRLMAELCAEDNERPRRISDPACGSGSTLLAEVARLIKAGRNPATHMMVDGTDISRTAILMCYIQLALWNVPATLTVGNTLTLEIREVWRTPALINPGLRCVS
jgi:type I restriction-modification system DNA methylase subunit